MRGLFFCYYLGTDEWTIMSEPIIFKIITEEPTICSVRLGAKKPTAAKLLRSMPKGLWVALKKPTTSTREELLAAKGKFATRLEDAPEFGTGILEFKTELVPQLAGFDPRKAGKTYKVATLMYDKLQLEVSYKEFIDGINWLVEYFYDSKYAKVCGNPKIYAIGLNHEMELVDKKISTNKPTNKK